MPDHNLYIVIQHDAQQVVANPDGSVTVEAFSGPVQVPAGSGWTPVDPTLRPDGVGGYMSGPTLAPVRIGDPGGLVDWPVGGGRFGVGWPGGLAGGVVSGASVTYPVGPGQSVVVSATPLGFETRFVLASRPVVAPVFSLPLVSSGLRVTQDGQGLVHLVNAAGVDVADSSATIMSGAGIDPRSGDPSRSEPVAMSVVGAAGAQVLRIAPDPAFLADPTVRYPVTIDPQFYANTSTESASYDTYTYCQPATGYGCATAEGSYDPNPNLKVGSYDGGADVTRSYLYFDVGGFAGSHGVVSNAYLAVNNFYAYSCVSGSTPALSLSGAGGPRFTRSGTTWDNQPNSDGLGVVSSAVFAHGYSSACPGAWVDLGATSLAQRWANGAVNNGIFLQTTESNSYGWKKFYNGAAGSNAAPALYITYAPDVQTPTGAVTVDRSTFTPRMSVTARAVSPETETVYFYARTAGSSTVNLVNGASVSVPSGSTASMPLPAGSVPPGGSFVWWTKACDTVGCSADSASVTATVDPLLGAGDRPWFSYDTHRVTDRMGMKVNVLSGNLLVETSDLSVPGVTTALTLGRTYNSAANAAGSSNVGGFGTGYGWQTSTGSDVRLAAGGAGSYRVWLPDGYVAQFVPGCGGLCTPPGVDATLVHNAAGTFTLTFHTSGEVMTFSAAGQLTGDADRDGNTVGFAYTSCAGVGQVSSVTGTRGDPQGRTVTASYDPTSCDRTGWTQTTSTGVSRSVRIVQTGHQETQVTDAAGRVYTFGYDTGHDLTSITGPDGNTWTISYDTAHRVVSLTQPGGNCAASPTVGCTRYVYGVNETDVYDANNHETRYLTDAADAGYDRVSSVIDADGNTQTAGYTPDQKISSFVNSLSGTTSLSYQANGGESLTQISGPTGAVTTLGYSNTAGSTRFLPSTVTSPAGTTETFSYDGPGNFTGTSATTPSGTAQAYVQYTQPGSTIAPAGSVAFTTTPTNAGTGSDAADCTNTVTGKVDNCAYDRYAGTGRNGTTGNLLSVTPPSGNSLKPETFSYDGYGRVHTMTTGSGVSVTYSYDNLDRVIGVGYSDTTPAVSNTFNADGDLTRRVDGTGTTTFGYDNRNELTSKTAVNPAGTRLFKLSYTYDPVGNLATLVDGRGSDRFGYDPTNLLTSLTESNGHVDVFAYTAAGQRVDTWDNATGYTLTPAGQLGAAPTGFAAHQHTTVDTAGRLTGLTASYGSSDASTHQLENLTISYRNSANTDTNRRQTLTDQRTGQTTSYSYDSLGRLAAAVTSSGGPTYSYCYDADGNLTATSATTVLDCATAAPHYAYNSADQLTTGGTTTNPDGNLTSSPLSTPALSALGYNGAQQTTSITPTGQPADLFGYAGTGQAERTSQSAPTATSYTNGLTGVQSQTNNLGAYYFERDPNGTLISERTPQGEYYYLTDPTGSVTALVNATGTPVAAYTYDPYGAHPTISKAQSVSLAIATNNPNRYTGGLFDPTTGLYHLGARYYDPTLTRFTSPDPAHNPTNLLQNNPYTYTGDNPANFIDPTGQSAFGDILGGLAAIATGAGALTALYASAPYAAEASAALLVASFGLGVGAIVIGVVLLGLGVYEAA